MGRSDDKIITIRFNPKEMKMLQTVLDKRYSGWWDSTSSIIKDILREEYLKIINEDDSTSCNTPLR